MTEAPQAEQAVPADVAAPAPQAASLWSEAWYDLRRNPLFIISSLLIALLVVMAAWPALFSSIDATEARHCDLNRAREEMSSGHWFGWDNQGCDVYSRTIYGARNSIV